jgi:tetratricopeptide (TPR) repeat protein
MAATILGEIPEALEKLQQAHVLHQQIGGQNPFISIVSLWSQSWCAYIAETPRQMLEYALQALEVCRTSNKPEWEPMMNYTAAWASMLLGQLVEGEQAAREALKKAEQHGVVGAQGWANLVLAFLAIQAGRWEEAQQTGDKAYTIATMLQDADLQARVLWSRSVCAGWQGDWERAIAEVLEGLQLARQEGDILLMVYPHLLIQAAKAYFHAGKPAEAQTYLDAGMQLAQSRRYRQLPAIGLRLQGRIWTAQGKFEEAQPCFEQSLSELVAIDDRVEYARTQEAYGLFYLARNSAGDFECGQSLIKRAQATFERLGVNG